MSYSQIDPNMLNAIVAIEDSRYWVHGAIDLGARSARRSNDLEHKPVQGGSTLAQQYVKNVLLLSADTPAAPRPRRPRTRTRSPQAATNCGWRSGAEHSPKRRSWPGT